MFSGYGEDLRPALPTGGGRRIFLFGGRSRFSRVRPDFLSFLRRRWSILSDMREWLESIFNWTAFLREHAALSRWLTAILLVAATCAIVRVLRKIIPPILHRSLNRQMASLLGNTIMTLVWVFSGIQTLSVLGVDVVSILGAAGVAGIAVGFASQTSLSNLISGVFLVGEKSIKLGDWVQVQGYSGSVESIDLLSVKIRGADNSLVRIPNESFIKNPVQNMTEDSLRRCDFDIGVDYAADLAQVEELIRRIADGQKLLLKNPPPVVQFVGFADSSLAVHVGVWCRTPDYARARFDFARSLLSEFRKARIDIPFPIRTVRISPSPPVQDEETPVGADAAPGRDVQKNGRI